MVYYSGSHQAEIKLSARPVISSKLSGSLSGSWAVGRTQFLEATGLRPFAPTQVVTVPCLHNLAVYFFKIKGKTGVFRRKNTYFKSFLLLTSRDIFCRVFLGSCPTLCNPTDGSPPGSPVPGTLKARTLQWVAISSPVHESEK